jgi:hypothetical protein
MMRKDWEDDSNNLIFGRMQSPTYEHVIGLLKLFETSVCQAGFFPF